MFLVGLGLYIYVLNVSMRFGVVFCIYEHILKTYLGFFQKNINDFSKFDFSSIKMVLNGLHPNPHPWLQQKSLTRGQTN